MSGTAEGARKARDKNLKQDPDFYANIGSRSWKNPNRSRKTGFALLSREKVQELGQKGGKKTKNEYTPKEASAKVRIEKADGSVSNHYLEKRDGYWQDKGAKTEEEYVTAEEIRQLGVGADLSE